MTGLQELMDIVEQQKQQIANLVRRHSELRDEHVALCSCLEASGKLVTSQRVQAMAHRHRFKECRKKHPCNLEGSLDAVLHQPEIVIRVASYGGPLVMARFGCVSHSARSSVNEACSTYKWNMPMVCILGGSRGYGRELGTVDMYHPEAGGWKVPEAMPRPRTDSSAVVVGDRIIVIGGGTNTVDAFDPWAKKWSSLPNMRYDRSYAALVAMGESIWALGGSTRNENNEIESRREIEKLDLCAGKEWEVMPDMPTRRAGLAAAVLGGMIHVVGGQIHQGDDNAAYLASMERFDPKVGEWELLPSMRSPRACAAAVQLHGKLYVMGGYDVRGFRHGDQIRELRTVERYDPELNKWESLGHMHVARFGAAAAAVNDVICVFGGRRHYGGHEESPALVTAETYDPKSNQWRRLYKMQLNVGRWGGAAVAIGC